MDEAMILETSFLVDLERETSAATPDRCRRFLRKHGDTLFFLTHTVAGELACGAALAERDRWERLVSGFHVLAHTAEVDWHYGQLFRHLKRQGQLFGANDLWIAATALAHGLPLVTRNRAHYERVPGLDVRPY
jgi:tRNA(fMet)-specific endonuclease VapC